MSTPLPAVYLARHGETAWAISGQHTGLTDLPLTERGAGAAGVMARVRALDGDVLLFSSSHFLRVLGSRWLGLDPAGGRYLWLSTATLSIVGYEHDKNEPVIRLWNDGRHVGA